MNLMVKALTIEDLVARGAPQVFTATSGEWKAIFVDWFENHEDGPKRKLYPAQSEMVFIDLLSYGFSLLGQEAQFAIEQRWLAFAKKTHLDLMAANNSTYRLLASPAVVTMQFTLAAARPVDTVVPPDTKVAAGDVEFATDDNLIIAAGDVSGTIAATASVAGIAANGFAAGEVSALIDDFEVDLTVANLDTSTGGADEESDEALVYRAANAHDRISKAGPRESYRQQVLAYSPSIIAVAITRPEPGDINIYPLLDSGIPDAAFLAGVLSWMDYETKRPEGDDLFALSPEAVTFGIDATVRGTGDLAALSIAAVDALTIAAEIWSKQLGPYLALSVLTCAAKQINGVIDIEFIITGLADRQLDQHQFAVLTGIVTTMEAG